MEAARLEPRARLRMKRLLPALMMMCCLFLGSCSKTYKDIKVTSFDIVSITPKGLDAVDAVIDVGIDNPIMGFELFNAVASVKMKGVECIQLFSDQLVLEGHSEKVYRIPLHGKLSSSFNPLELLTIVKDMDFSQFTMDAKARVNLRGGIGKDIDIKDIKLEKFLKKQ